MSDSKVSQRYPHRSTWCNLVAASGTTKALKGEFREVKVFTKKPRVGKITVRNSPSAGGSGSEQPKRPRTSERPDDR